MNPHDLWGFSTPSYWPPTLPSGSKHRAGRLKARDHDERRRNRQKRQRQARAATYRR